jgi:hypothetical protein
VVVLTSSQREAPVCRHCKLASAMHYISEYFSQTAPMCMRRYVLHKVYLELSVLHWQPHRQTAPCSNVYKASTAH